MTLIRAFTAPGLLSTAPELAFNVQEEPPLLHDELPWPGLRPVKIGTLFSVLLTLALFLQSFSYSTGSRNAPRLGQPESLSNGPSMNWALIL
jgi:hypothetical protein